MLTDVSWRMKEEGVGYVVQKIGNNFVPKISVSTFTS